MSKSSKPNNKPSIEITKEKIAEFCRKWKIREFALFGSVLREDFRPDSDIDVHVTFSKDARHTLVDIVSRRGIEAWEEE